MTEKRKPIVVLGDEGKHSNSATSVLYQSGFEAYEALGFDDTKKLLHEIVKAGTYADVVVLDATPLIQHAYNTRSDINLEFIINQLTQCNDERRVHLILRHDNSKNPLPKFLIKEAKECGVSIVEHDDRSLVATLNKIFKPSEHAAEIGKNTSRAGGKAPEVVVLH